jgi:hypothetical protein
MIINAFEIKIVNIFPHHFTLLTLNFTAMQSSKVRENYLRQ